MMYSYHGYFEELLHMIVHISPTLLLKSILQCIVSYMVFFNFAFVEEEDFEPAPPSLVSNKPKNQWDDEDVDDENVKESWEDEEEPVQVLIFGFDVPILCLCTI